MLLESQIGDMLWFSDNNINIRMKTPNKETSVAWVSINKYDASLAMMLCDFQLWCENEFMNLSIDKSWNKHTGFCFHNEPHDFIPIFIIEFINYWKIKPYESGHLFTDGEWYQY